MSSILRRKESPAPIVIPVKNPEKPASLENRLRSELVELWMRDLGQLEYNGKNRSEMIDAVNNRMDVDMGSPYCIAGLLARGVEVLCTRNKLQNPVTMTAGTQNFWRRAPERFKKVKGKRASKADICILVNIGDPGHGHAYGMRMNEVAVQYTIEYNTNKAGSRDGDGVWSLERTQRGTSTKEYRGAVDVIAWILSVNS